MNINTPRSGGGFSRHFGGGGDSVHKSSSHSAKSNRIPFLKHIPDAARNHFVATTAEFVGTTLFLFFAFSGTQVALLAGPTEDSVIGAVSNPAQLLYISLCFGFSLAVNAWVFFRISGGLFNPAVTLGMCLVGALPWLRGVLLCFSQILGGITAAGICSALFPGPLTVRTSLGGGTSVVQGLFIEMFLTAMLVFTIFMLAAEKHKGTFIAPIGIGLSLFIAELTGVYFTGGSVNPARSFGPSVVAHTFNTYHWIYWVGPILGSMLASGFYLFIKMLEYETANPGQDRAIPEGEHFDPDLFKDARVSFAPNDHASQMEEGKMQVNEHPMQDIGDPQEYGAEDRPYSTSPAPPHPNDQFAALNDDLEPQYTNNSHTIQSPSSKTSDMTLHSHMAPYPGSSSLQHTTRKPAMKPGSRGSISNSANGKERSVRHNTHHNRKPSGGIPADEERHTTHHIRRHSVGTQDDGRRNTQQARRPSVGIPPDEEFYDRD